MICDTRSCCAGLAPPCSLLHRLARAGLGAESVFAAAVRTRTAVERRRRNPVCVRLEGQLAAVRPRRYRSRARRPDQALRGRGRQAAGRARSRHRAVAPDGLRRPRLLLAVQRAAAAMQPAQQPDPADARQSRPRARRSAALRRAAAPTAKASVARSWSRSDRTTVARNIAPTRTGAAAVSSRACSAPAPSLNPGRRRAPRHRAHTRTLCVRTCDGYYFPISYSTAPSRVRRRRADLPAHVPGGRSRALHAPQSRRGRCAGGVDRRRSPTRSCPTRSPIARSSTRPAAARRPGQTWADALKHARRPARSSAATSS